MDYEKKYKEALERVENIKTGKCETTFMFTEGLFEYVFPELKESEDERIRKHLLYHFRNKTKKEWNGIPINDILAWLEKQGETFTKKDIDDTYLKGVCDAKHELENQGEQKPAAWSDEDEKFFKTALWHISYSISNSKSTDIHCDTTDWLKSLKDRVQPQPKQEWSEEDKETIDLTIAVLKENLPNGYFKTNPINTLNMGGIHTDELIEKLKSLSPQNRWKPSETDIRIFEQIIDGIANPISYSATLHVILEQLKKLREE